MTRHFLPLPHSSHSSPVPLQLIIHLFFLDTMANALLFLTLTVTDRSSLCPHHLGCEGLGQGAPGDDAAKLLAAVAEAIGMAVRCL